MCSTDRCDHGSLHFKNNKRNVHNTIEVGRTRKICATVLSHVWTQCSVSVRAYGTRDSGSNTWFHSVSRGSWWWRVTFLKRKYATKDRTIYLYSISFHTSDNTQHIVFWMCYLYLNVCEYRLRHYVMLGFSSDLTSWTQIAILLIFFRRCVTHNIYQMKFSCQCISSVIERPRRRIE